MDFCQRCGIRPAVTQIQKVTPDGRLVFVSLCGECVRELQALSSKTACLDRYGRDLTELAREGKLDPVIGRKDEIDRVTHILSRRTKNNPVLIGDPGVGKTAIVEGLAQRIVGNLVPETLQEKRLIQLDLASMLAGASYRGEFEKRLKNTINEVKKSQGQIILFIDELHTVVGAGAASGAIDASNMLKPSLARGELRCIGATTLDEFRQYIERDGALERRFQPILVSEPTVEETIDILKGLRERYEHHHHVEITDEAIETAAKFSDRYVSDRFLPDKAVDLIDEAASKVRLSAVKEPENLRQVEDEIKKIRRQPLDLASKQRLVELENVRSELMQLWLKTKMEEVPRVEKEHVAGIVSRMTGVPLEELTESEKIKLLKLEERIHQRIVNQEEAVKSVAEAIRRSRSGLKDPKRPIGSFIFLGPTGVGKTELTKALSEILYGSEDLMARLDMSEYAEKHTVSRMVGAPPGYIGFERGGQLTEIVRRRPFSVILFDEIEKAHPEVLNILLQIMEDGRLTDGHGRTVDFKNTILIMTSNIGSELIFEKSSLGFVAGKQKAAKYEDLKDDVLKMLRETFRPEFLNRVDDVVIFKSLNQPEIERIANLELGKLSRLMAEQGIAFSVSTKAQKWLAKEGFDPQLGARPLKRLIQTQIENPLSGQIISGEFRAGDEVKIDLARGKLVFEPAKVKIRV